MSNDKMQHLVHLNDANSYPGVNRSNALSPQIEFLDIIRAGDIQS